MRRTSGWAALVVLLTATSLTAQTSTTNETPANPPAQTQSANNTPPPRTSTGWRTLIRDTASDFKAFPRRKSTWTLLGIGAAGALAGHQGDSYVQTHIVGNDNADKVFKLGKVVGNAEVEAGAAVGLWAVGRYVFAPAADEPKTNKYSHIGFDLMRAQIVTQTLVHAVKYTARRDRPTGECCAFPSGHAASAFAFAAVLERHLGYRGSWPALVGATYVATSRLVDNRHFLSDVIFGAALGEAAGWTIVGRHGRQSYALQPVPVRGGIMLTLARVED